MATENLQFRAEVDTNPAKGSIGSLRTQIKQATQDLIKMSDEFGVTSKEAADAAKRVAELRDRLGDAQNLAKAFNPDAKFAAVSASISGVASGFAALQGAMALFGTENDKVAQTLLKVQSAMAISQGLQGLGESIDSFKQLGAVIKNMSLVQSAYNFILGSSVKIKEEDIAITEADAVANGELAAAETAVATATTGASTAMRVFRAALVATGIGAVVVGVGLLVDYLMDLANASKKAADDFDTLNKSVETYLEYSNRIISDTEKINEIRIAKLKASGAKEAKIYEEQRKDNLVMTDLYERQYYKMLEAYEKYHNKWKDSEDEKTKDNIEKLRKQAWEAYDKWKNQEHKTDLQAYEREEALRKKREEKEKQALEKKKEALKQISDAEKAYTLSTMDDAEKEKRQVQDKYRVLLDLAAKYGRDATILRQAMRDEMDKIDEKYTIQENERAAAAAKYVQDWEVKFQQDAQKAADEKVAKEIEANEKKIKIEQESFEYRKSLGAITFQDQIDSFEKTRALERENLVKKKATDDEMAAFDKATASARIALERQVQDAKLDIINAGVSAAIEIVGKESAAGKALSIAQAVMNTYTGATRALKDVPYPYNFIAAATTIAQGFMSVKKIIATPLPNNAGGNSSAPSMSSASPVTPQLPQAQLTQLNQQSINDIGNNAIKAYVVETDVTASQARVSAIRNRSSFR